MADIVIHNPRCISRLFDVFLKRILEMTASPSSAARAAAVNALQRTAMALFERSKAAITEGSAGPDEAVECCIMRGIEEVFQQPNAPADVQFACLDMVHHLIQVSLTLLCNAVFYNFLQCKERIPVTFNLGSIPNLAPNISQSS
jgi:hypothetical protein